MGFDIIEEANEIASTPYIRAEMTTEDIWVNSSCTTDEAIQMTACVLAEFIVNIGAVVGAYDLAETLILGDFSVELRKRVKLRRAQLRGEGTDESSSDNQ